MNSETKFTPGPWQVGRIGPGGMYPIGPTGHINHTPGNEQYRDPIAYVAEPDRFTAAGVSQSDMRKANGLLITVAPDLYECLRELVDPTFLPIAEGGSIHEQVCAKYAAARAALAKATGGQP